MTRLFFGLGSLSGGLAVALGAFGAHILESRLPPERLATFDTAVQYQMYHALALLAAAWAGVQWQESRLPDLAGWFFLGGTILFSGSLYALSLSGVRWFGAITPLGGISFLVGWGCLAFVAGSFL